VPNAINPNDVTFDCKLEQGPGAFTLSYKLQNRSGRDLVVYNRIPTTDVDGTLRYSSNNVYVDLDGHNLLVRLMILPLDLPPGVKLGWHPLPDAMVLEAGAELAERVVVTEPARVRNPVRLRGMSALLRYDAKSPHRHYAAMTPGSAATLTFAVGVAALVPGTVIEPVSKAFPGVLMPPLTEGGQIVLTKDFRLSRPVAVLDYALSE